MTELVYVLVLEAKFCEFESRLGHHYGGVAQLGERQLCKLDVAGSIPVTSTKYAGLV